MFSRSGETFKDTWGETAGAGFGVGLVTVLFTLGGVLIAGLVFVAFGSSAVGAAGGLVIAVLVIFGAYLVGTTLTGIAKTALYIYATEGVQPAEFNDVDFRETVD